MGNNPTKESRPGSSRGHSHHGSIRDAPTNAGASSSLRGSDDRLYTSRGGRSSRVDLSFLGVSSSDREPPAVGARRETRAEREARKREKERELREKERERSVREENVDGGFLVTLGTYTGPEDFNKQVVRQLMIERRLAPFWKGLNDHSESWTEHQLVAAVKGLPIPPADEIPADDISKTYSNEQNPRSSDNNLNGLMVPITARSPSSQSDASGRLSPGQSGFSLPSPTSPLAQGNTTSSSPFFRGRAKTLAALTTSSRNNSQTEMIPQELMLPNDPYVNGQRVEAFLYKDASECPICFLYYPPYLNKTRCCDQPICSECFVQIKRPDPHPPEHHDPNDPNASAEPKDDCMLVSEPAACPFCVQPEFGVTYEPPPFRRGLIYQGQRPHNLGSAMSSSSSLEAGQPSPGGTGGNRRRATSLAANAPQVITTDKIRPDWAKKLADARAHALRRSAAATALHNAAYVMNNNPSDTRGFTLGRRRRTLFSGESPNSSGQGTPRQSQTDALGQLLAAAEAGSSRNARSEGQDGSGGRHTSRRSRMEDLEELMMMEAIRLSLAAEEERKKKEEKEAAKAAKKEEKRKAKEEKKAAKTGVRYGFHPIDLPDDDGSQAGPSSQADTTKGKEVDRSGVGFNPLNEPTSTLNAGAPSAAPADPQRHLEESRQRLQSQPIPQTDSPASPAPLDTTTGSHRTALRHLSNASSSASSFAESESERESLPNTTAGLNSGSSFEPSPNTSGLNLGGFNTPPGGEFSEDTAPGGEAGTDPMFNFRSLAAVIRREEEESKSGKAEHIEDVGAVPTQEQQQQQQQELAQPEPKPAPVAVAVAETEPTPPTVTPEDSLSRAPPSDESGTSGSSADANGSNAAPAAPPAIAVTPSSPPSVSRKFEQHGIGIAEAPVLPMPDLGAESLDQKISGDGEVISGRVGEEGAA